MATRGNMSAEIGHEMNNFLAVVAGNLSLLQLQLRKQKLDQVERHAFAISDTIDKMTVFTRNLMDLTPMSSKKEVVFFDRILSEALNYVEAQKRFRGIEIVRPQSIPELPFEADTIQIQQLLYNLFNNAADATNTSATRRISVSLTIADDTRHFIFSITDNGCGFDTEVVAKAFQERFTTKPTGHGFGLVVCRRIIDNHGGLLDLKSAPGKGATISITFPLLGTGEDTAPERRTNAMTTA
jgi:signal transduction histidine kinase